VADLGLATPKERYSQEKGWRGGNGQSLANALPVTFASYL
jgi:hypothetical protein